MAKDKSLAILLLRVIAVGVGRGKDEDAPTFKNIITHLPARLCKGKAKPQPNTLGQVGILRSCFIPCMGMLSKCASAIFSTQVCPFCTKLIIEHISHQKAEQGEVQGACHADSDFMSLDHASRGQAMHGEAGVTCQMNRACPVL